MPTSPVQAPDDPGRRFGTDPRPVYAKFSDPEALPPGPESLQRISALLREQAPHRSAAPLSELVKTAAEWSAGEADAYESLFAAVDGTPAGAVLQRRAVLSCAPWGLVSGAWLQWLSSPGNADDPVVLRILTLYATDLGVGKPRASRGDAYLALLRQFGVAEYADPTARIATDDRVPDASFHLPAVLLAMSRRPDRLRAEILGADLCMRAAGLPPPLVAVRARAGGAADWAALDPADPRQDDSPSTVVLAMTVAEELSAADAPFAERLRLGFHWARAELAGWSGRLMAELWAARDPAYEMAELLRRRAREGSVYHGEIAIAGKSLSQWLREARTDPGPLLAVLAESRLIKPGRAAASPLINGLVSERGPMFRVFAPEDLAVIGRWIDALPAAGGPAELPPPVLHPSPSEPEEPADREPADPAPADLREAYHRLLGRVDSPALRGFAEDYVRGWLARAGHRIDEAPAQLPSRWRPGGLRPWLLEQHDRHAAGFDREGPLPEREALVDSTVQLAPLTLIDGAWLQGFTDYGHGASDLGHFLFETYWDELGNGEARLNHPLIYREVLAEMGVNLPPTAAPEFARSGLLRDGSFELPVYWLSIGRLPRSFMPEILGLNLAMELSGVGGSYRRARLALKKYGFSTRFVDIHNTIDNVATGHSAWAADAVDSFMAAVSVAQGVGALETTWQRVRLGFRSLDPPADHWARRAQRRAGRAAKSA